MKVIAFCLKKGGVGKTSLSVSLAAQLAAYGKKVLLIDFDVQGNSSAWLVPISTIINEVADLLNGDKEFTEVVHENVWKTAAANGGRLDVLPTIGKGKKLPTFSEITVLQKPRAVERLLDVIRDYNYDFVVFDLPPAFNALERQAVCNSDEVITPVNPDPFGLEGLAQFAHELIQARKDLGTENPKYNKIIINRINKSVSKNIELREKIKSATAGMNVYEVPTDPIFAKAQDTNYPIQEYSAMVKKETRQALEQLAQDLQD